MRFDFLLLEFSLIYGIKSSGKGSFPLVSSVTKIRHIKLKPFKIL